MLQRVVVGQVRFNLPGLVVDARGVASGKHLAARFAAMDRLVGFLRALSAEQSLDDLQPGLRIVYARAAAGTREAVVFLPASAASAQLGDVVARAARLAGGQCFTGGGKHFAQFRDVSAPLGYDVVALAREPADFVLYGVEHDVPYHVDSELPLAKLLLRLSLRRDAATAWPAGPVLLAARRGLGPLVAEYLHRSSRESTRAAAALCEGSGGARSFWLFRIDGAPARLRGLLRETPGLDLYVPVAEHVAVAAGFSHPVALASCRSCFATDRLTLFPRSGGVLELAPAPVFTAVEHLVRLRAPSGREVEPARARPQGGEDVTVQLRLEPSRDARRRASAALVPWSRVAWLRRLCYALPEAALRGYRVAALEAGALVLAEGALEGLPFGVLLARAAPGVDVLVPLGLRLAPAVAPELLAERLGAEQGTLVVFPGGAAPPFRVAPELVEALDRHALSRLAKPEHAPAALRSEEGAPALEPIEVENDALGPMPLWGLGERAG